jgi:hypothetical protein
VPSPRAAALLFNVDVPDAHELSRRVASANGLDADAARRVLDAVLETLAEPRRP